MINARKTYYDYDIYPARTDFKPNKVTSKVMDGRKDTRSGGNYLHEDRFWFCTQGSAIFGRG